MGIANLFKSAAAKLSKAFGPRATMPDASAPAAQGVQKAHAVSFRATGDADVCKALFGDKGFQEVLEESSLRARELRGEQVDAGERLGRLGDARGRDLARKDEHEIMAAIREVDPIPRAAPARHRI